MIIIPAIDLRENKVVRLYQGIYTQQKNYNLSPLSVAQQFLNAGAKLIHLIDLDAARLGFPVHRDLILNLVEMSKRILRSVAVSGTLTQSRIILKTESAE